MTKSSPTKNVLIIALSGAGDVLMASPLIDALYDSCPETNLDILVQDGELTLELFQAHPKIRNICIVLTMWNSENQVSRS